MNIYPATGNKGLAQEKGLTLVTGDVFIITDGDTRLDKDFVKNIEIDFTDEKVAAVAGYVRSMKYNWLTACRAYDYAIGQNIHKVAQNILDFLFVIPGAGGAFRTDIFKKYIGFDHDTITEDLDFTYKLHKQNLKIKYDRDAIVYTQDPSDLKSYIRQMRRWFGGGCQNLLKHIDNDLITDPRRVFELTLIYIEGIIFSSLLFLIPLINIGLALKLLAFFLFATVIQAIYASIKEKRVDMLMVPPFYLFLMFVNSGIFLEQFFKEVVLRKGDLEWLSPERVAV
jgi:cellulose synthase/poly-beta-1,6-N-acetylglucosamine synthase-like glycosyltransferase